MFGVILLQFEHIWLIAQAMISLKGSSGVLPRTSRYLCLTYLMEFLSRDEDAISNDGNSLSNCAGVGDDTKQLE